MEVKNAVITSTALTSSDHGCLSGWLYLDYGGSCQGFGGYALYLPNSFTHSKGQLNYAGHFIYRILEIAGVEEWSKLPGKTIRVKAEHEKVHAIGHIVEEDWFDPSEDFKKMKQEILASAKEVK